MNVLGKYILACDLGHDIRAYMGVREKNWLPLVAAALSVGSSIYGGVKSSNANKQQRAELARNHASDNAWYLKNNNVKYADTASGRRTLERARTILQEQNKAFTGTSAVGGATTAAIAASKNSMNNAMANVAGNMSAVDTQRQMNAENAHKQDERNYTTNLMNQEAQRQNYIATAAQDASNAMMSAASVLDGDKTKKSVS